MVRTLNLIGNQLVISILVIVLFHQWAQLFPANGCYSMQSPYCSKTLALFLQQPAGHRTPSGLMETSQQGGSFQFYSSWISPYPAARVQGTTGLNV